MLPSMQGRWIQTIQYPRRKVGTDDAKGGDRQHATLQGRWAQTTSVDTVYLHLTFLSGRRSTIIIIRRRRRRRRKKKKKKVIMNIQISSSWNEP